jgi:hypothetical protein
VVGVEAAATGARTRRRHPPKTAAKPTRRARRESRETPLPWLLVGLISSPMSQRGSPSFWSKLEIDWSKVEGSGAEEVGPRLEETLHPLVRESGPVRHEKPDHSVPVNDVKGAKSRPTTRMHDPGFYQSAQVHGKPAFAQPGARSELRYGGLPPVEEGEEKKAGGPGSREAKEPTVAERHFGRKVVVLGAAPFSVDQSGIGQTVEVVGRLAPPGLCGPLNLPGPDPRRPTNCIVDPTPCDEDEQILVHRSDMSRPQGGGEQQQRREKDQGQDREVRDRPRWRIQGYFPPSPEDTEQGQDGVGGRQPQESSIAGTSERTYGDRRVHARDPRDQDRREEFREPHGLGESVRRFKELVQKRKGKRGSKHRDVRTARGSTRERARTAAGTGTPENVIMVRGFSWGT